MYGLEHLREMCNWLGFVRIPLTSEAAVPVCAREYEDFRVAWYFSASVGRTTRSTEAGQGCLECFRYAWKLPVQTFVSSGSESERFVFTGTTALRRPQRLSPVQQERTVPTTPLK